MTDPVITTLVKDTWTKVCTSTYAALISIASTSTDATTKRVTTYYITDVDAGTSPASAYLDARQKPIDTLLGAQVMSDVLKDVYVIARNAVGSIRVSV